MPETFRYSRYRGHADSYPFTAFPKDYVHYYPLVDVKLRYQESTTPPLTAYIDSGSAYCIFGSETAELLNIQVRSGRRTKDVYGLGGGSLDLYFFSLELLINSTRLNCYVGFMDQEFPGNKVYMGILGDYDFLSEIPLTLDVPKLEIRLG